MMEHTIQELFPPAGQPKPILLEDISKASRAMTREFMKETIRDFEDIAPLSLYPERAALVHAMILLRIRLFDDLARANLPGMSTENREKNHESPSMQPANDRSTDGLQEPGNELQIPSRHLASEPEAVNSTSGGFYDRSSTSQPAQAG